MIVTGLAVASGCSGVRNGTPTAERAPEDPAVCLELARALRDLSTGEDKCMRHGSGWCAAPDLAATGAGRDPRRDHRCAAQFMVQHRHGVGFAT